MHQRAKELMQKSNTVVQRLVYLFIYLFIYLFQFIYSFIYFLRTVSTNTEVYLRGLVLRKLGWPRISRDN